MASIAPELTALLTALSASLKRGEKAEWALVAFLQNIGLTEYRGGEWCQSGAQMGWSPDLDGTTPCVKVGQRDDGYPTLTVANDIFSLRVAAIVVGARLCGYDWSVQTPPNDCHCDEGEDAFDCAGECGAWQAGQLL